jgi:hypothetical protein
LGREQQQQQQQEEEEEEEEIDRLRDGQQTQRHNTHTYKRG